MTVRADVTCDVCGKHKRFDVNMAVARKAEPSRSFELVLPPGWKVLPDGHEICPECARRWWT